MCNYKIEKSTKKKNKFQPYQPRLIFVTNNYLISINKPSIWWCFVFPRKITVRKFWSLRHTEIGNWNYSLTSKNNSKRNTNQVWFITSGATENEKTHNSKLGKSSGRSGGTWMSKLKNQKVKQSDRAREQNREAHLRKQRSRSWEMRLEEKEELGFWKEGVACNLKLKKARSEGLSKTSIIYILKVGSGW